MLDNILPDDASHRYVQNRLNCIKYNQSDHNFVSSFHLLLGFGKRFCTNQQCFLTTGSYFRIFNFVAADGPFVVTAVRYFVGVSCSSLTNITFILLGLATIIPSYNSNATYPQLI